MASVCVVLRLASAPSLPVGRGRSLTPGAKRGRVLCTQSGLGTADVESKGAHLEPPPLHSGALSKKEDKADSSGGTGHKLPNVFGPGCDPLT